MASTKIAMLSPNSDGLGCKDFSYHQEMTVAAIRYLTLLAEMSVTGRGWPFATRLEFSNT